MSDPADSSTPRPPGRIAVTGGSKGIGRAIVRRLIDDGHRVVNLDRVAPDATLAGEQWVAVDLADAAATRAVAAELGKAERSVYAASKAGLGGI